LFTYKKHIWLNKVVPELLYTSQSYIHCQIFEECHSCVYILNRNCSLADKGSTLTHNIHHRANWQCDKSVWHT